MNIMEGTKASWPVEISPGPPDAIWRYFQIMRYTASRLNPLAFSWMA
jgi:hypothetical protein